MNEIELKKDLKIRGRLGMLIQMLDEKIQELQDVSDAAKGLLKDIAEAES